MSDLTETEQEAYLRNVVIVARADGKVTAAEKAVIDRACAGIGASQRQLKAALSTFGDPDIHLEALERFSTRIRNFEDMLEAAICDGEMSATERELLLRAALGLGIGQETINRMLAEAQKRLTRVLAG